MYRLNTLNGDVIWLNDVILDGVDNRVTWDNGGNPGKESFMYPV